MSYTAMTGLAEFNAKIAIAFKDLRKQKIVAKRRWQCCGNCGVCALEGLPTFKDKTAIGATFAHAQDETRLKESFAASKPGLYLNFTSSKPDDPDGTVAVGQKIKEACEKAGLKVEWDGTGIKKILVVP